jgi:hypothetical protein
LPWLLWLLLGLFVFRVTAQLLVANSLATFLPPMAAWHSGVVPYQLLVPGQLLLIAVLAKVCLDFTQGRGFFVRRKPTLGTALLVFGVIYLGFNTTRYVLYLAPSPAEHLVHLPVFFHYVLATFVLSVGAYHRVAASHPR